MMIAGAGILTVGIAYRDQPRQEHVGEYFALLATAAAGMMFMVSASNLMTLFLGLEWFSISLYVLCAIDIELETSLESGLKYLIVGSFGSAILLFGFALVYGATGALELGAIGEAGRALEHDSMLLVGLAMVLTGLGFKASAAPFHQWTPDVYQGSPTPVTAFMSAATKVTALVVMLRVLNTAFPAQEDFWSAAVAGIAVASLAIGNLAALVQRNVKRMLAYSSVSHAGFMLIPIAAANELGGQALLYYLIPYGAASLGAFAIVAARERELRQPVTLDNLSGMGWERPFLGFSLALFAFAFIGLPPGGLFMGKLFAFSAAVDADMTWLVIVGVIATAVSVYYYLAIVRSLYMRTELRLVPAGGAPPRELLLTASVVVTLAIVVGSFVFVQPLLDLAGNAADSLGF
jgi:NADH-quinone oxidoreductase subunit N